LNLPIWDWWKNNEILRCPDCGKRTSQIFSGNGLEKLIFDPSNWTFLAELEMDPNIGLSADQGKPYIYFYNKMPSAQNLMDMAVESAGKDRRR
jgi:hypothetical protein